MPKLSGLGLPSVKNIVRIFASVTVAAFLMALGSAVFLQRGPLDFAGVSIRGLDHYARAAKSTVLVETAHGSGSGVVVIRQNAEGRERVFVWTAAHVVSGVDNLSIRVTHRHDAHKAGLSYFDARVVYRDEKLDIALVQVQASPEHFVSATFDFGVPYIGLPTFHFGNLFGVHFEGSLTTGVLSQVGVRPESPSWPWELLDQTTALAVPGSSGGPVFNGRNGQVLGLIVGGPGVAGISCYVPVRQLVRSGQLWALRGTWCPSDSLLDDLALTATSLPKSTLTDGCH